MDYISILTTPGCVEGKPRRYEGASQKWCRFYGSDLGKVFAVVKVFGMIILFFLFQDGYTCKHIAARLGNTYVMKELLPYGADEESKKM